MQWLVGANSAKKKEYLFAKTQIKCYHAILHTVGGLPKNKSLINAGHP